MESDNVADVYSDLMTCLSCGGKATGLHIELALAQL